MQNNSISFGMVDLKTATFHEGYIDENNNMAYKKEGKPIEAWEVIASKNITWQKDISQWAWSEPKLVTYSRLLVLEKHKWTNEKRAYYIEADGMREYVDVKYAQGIMGIWF